MLQSRQSGLQLASDRAGSNDIPAEPVRVKPGGGTVKPVAAGGKGAELTLP